MKNSSSDRRPNILFLNTDQQSASMMSCAGNPYLKTPAMDRLAREGIRFERAYTTNPVCLPARFSFFTGRMPSEQDIWFNKSLPHHYELPDEILQNTAGQLLRKAGYRVAYGGKVHLPGNMSPETMGCENITPDGRDGLAEVGAAWLREQGRKKDRPFFLTLCLINPHDICFMGMRDFIRDTRGCDPDLNKNERWLLSDDSVEMRELNQALSLPEGMSEAEFFDQHCPPLPPNHPPQQNEPGGIRDLMAKEEYRTYIRENWDERTWRLHRWAYCRLTERVDGQIGVLLQALDDAGLTDNTLVIFTSDHGDLDGSHKLDQKGLPYEEAVRVPLLLRWPGKVPAGRVETHHLVSNGLDLLPTLCEVAGFAPPAHVKGASLLPLAVNVAEVPHRDALPLEWQNGRGMVRGNFKYLLYQEGEHCEQFMDLKRDPCESENHLEDPDLRQELTACRQAFARLFG